MDSRDGAKTTRWGLPSGVRKQGSAQTTMRTRPGTRNQLERDPTGQIRGNLNLEVKNTINRQWTTAWNRCPHRYKSIGKLRGHGPNFTVSPQETLLHDAREKNTCAGSKPSKATWGPQWASLGVARTKSNLEGTSDKPKLRDILFYKLTGLSLQKVMRVRERLRNVPDWRRCSRQDHATRWAILTWTLYDKGHCWDKRWTLNGVWWLDRVMDQVKLG